MLQIPAGLNYIRLEVSTAVIMKNAAFWDIKLQFVPHRKHYVSTTEPKLLMLCTIRGFHGDDYEECGLLGYKNMVRTSQETPLRYRAQPIKAIYD
jgi:hypothetical protein